MALESYGVPLFPIPLGLYNLGEPHNRQDLELIDGIFNARVADPIGVTQSQVNGWHSTNLIHQDSCFEELCALVTHYAEDYTEKFGLDAKLSVPGCWANINERGGFNMPHHHNGNTLAGVYYPCQHVTSDGERVFNYSSGNPIKPGSWGENGGELVFHSPNYALYSGVKMKPNHPYTVSHYHMSPQSGVLLLFPPYLIHSVVPVMDDHQRLSISFKFGQQ